MMLCLEEQLDGFAIIACRLFKGITIGKFSHFLLAFTCFIIKRSQNREDLPSLPFPSGLVVYRLHLCIKVTQQFQQTSQRVGFRYNHTKWWSKVKSLENHAQLTKPPPLNVVVPGFILSISAQLQLYSSPGKRYLRETEHLIDPSSDDL